MTFADLMSLLMCFFVLLLSFSEMDVSKYKEMAGSMKNAFGVQRELQVKEPPKGINVIAREFSPGRPDPTPLNVIRQMTTSDHDINLYLGKLRKPPVRTPRDKLDAEAKETQDPGGENEALTEIQQQELEKAKQLAAARLEKRLSGEGALEGGREYKSVTIDDKSLEDLVKAKLAAERLKKLEQSAKLISAALGDEIKAGSVDVETAGQKIIIRVREKASFGSGRAELKDDFIPLLQRVAGILKDSEGKIIVAGHTDNVPIYTERYRSNWELSAARAVSVAHAMMDATDIPSDRFLVQGFADTAPVAKNDSVANRAANRRVEIVLQQGDDKESDDRAISGEKAVARESDRGQTVAVPTPAASSKPAPASKTVRQDTTAAVRSPAPAPVAKKQPTATAIGVRVGGTKSTGSDPAPSTAQSKKSTGGSSSVRVGGSE
jgi:chemotaxis protein MotB